MDSDRFDALTRALAAPGSRRRLLGGLAAAAAAALLGGLGPGDAAAHSTLRRCKRIEDRKKRAACVKKAKRHAQTHADAAPPCTADGCPLPPGCSQEALDACGTAWWDAALAEAKAACGEACAADPESAACRDCLAPIVEARLPEAEACVAETCPPPAAAGASADGEVRAAGDWWARQCPTACCKLPFLECMEEMRDEFLICMGSALGAAIVTGGPGAVGALACFARMTYGTAKCRARQGCVDGKQCLKDGVCCSAHKACGAACCAAGESCVDGQCKEDGCAYCTSHGLPCCQDPATGTNYCCQADGVCCPGQSMTGCCGGSGW